MKNFEKHHLQETTRATVSIDSLPQPVILVSPGRTIIAANARAVEIFGEVDEGKDLSSMVRHPEFLGCVTGVLQSDLPDECEFVRLGRQRRTFSATVSPYPYKKSAGAFVAFQETTLASDAERMRSSFVADVSHELRSPLTTLIATNETLKGRAGEQKETRARFIDIMAREMIRMNRIVDDLLSLSLTESHEHILPDEHVNFGQIISDITVVLSEKAKQKDMTIKCGPCDGLPDTRGSFDELYQALRNLIDNAIKYGDRGSIINVTCVLGVKHLHVSIHNWGEVIAEDHIPRLTERFYRVDRSRSRELGGTGLGLAIVKHIVNRHQGRLRITSSKEEGTTFTISLPTDL